MAITPEQLAWLNFVKVSSLPLRRIAANGMPDSVASGCIVNYRGRKFVLSVSHATGNGDNWAAELKHVQGRGTELYRFGRSEEHTSELQSLMRISYAVFCLTKKNT